MDQSMLERFTKKNLRKLLGAIKVVLTRKATLKRKVNFLLSAISSILGFDKSWGKPLRIIVEPTNVCDQKCPICETGNGTLGRAKQFMSDKQFNYIVDQFDDTLEEIFFYFMGEPFLNKDSYKMIKYATDKGVTVTTCTDGNFVKAKDLIDSGITTVNFQIGGITQETHEVYRIKGKLSKALETMEEAIKYRNEVGSKTKIVCGFILMKHNEHEVQTFIDYCNKIGVDSYEIIGSCIRELGEWEIYMPTDPKYQIYDPVAYQKGKIVPKSRPDNFCGELYTATSIQVNGDIVSCCRDPKGNNILGNIFEQDFYKDIWNNKKYQKLRNQVNNHSNKLKLCELCPGEGLIAPIDQSNL